MILSSYMFRRATIVGVGLIGGSVGLALKKHKIAKEIVGLSHRQSALAEALKIQAIDVGATDLPRTISNSDLVILAAPVDGIVKLLSQINPHLRRGTIVTDVGSTKAEIVETAHKVLSAPENFIGAHPLAGSEKKGVEFSNGNLFENSVCLVTPHEHTNPGALKRVTQMWSKFGAHVKTLKPQEHDASLAYISHLPHVLAYSLIETIPEKYLEYAATGLKDMTRIGASSPKMWTSIALANTKPLVHSLDDLIKHLAEMRKLLVERNEREIEQHFIKSKEKRDKLS